MLQIKVPLCYKLTSAVTPKNAKRCRDGNVCEAYVIPFLFGSFFTVCHPYIDVHFFYVTCINISPLGIEFWALENPQGDPGAMDGRVRPEGTDDDLHL